MVVWSFLSLYKLLRPVTIDVAADWWTLTEERQSYIIHTAMRYIFIIIIICGGRRNVDIFVLGKVIDIKLVQ
jgi:hypothetical protein